MVKMRDLPEGGPEGILRDPEAGAGFKSIRELATFLFTCRRCREAPCIAVCPSDALEKSENGIITRALHACVRCKSCVAICPFGTLMDDLFEKKDRKSYFDLGDDEQLEGFVKASPGQAISFYEGDEDPEKHVYKLNDRILVRDYVWET